MKHEDVDFKPLAVSFGKAGRLIDRSPRTIKRMVDRGDLEVVSGERLIIYASLEDWLYKTSSRESPPSPASARDGAPRR